MKFVIQGGHFLSDHIDYDAKFILESPNYGHYVPPFAAKIAVNGVELCIIHSLVNWREPNTIFFCIIGALEIISKPSSLSSTVPCRLLKFLNQDGHLLSHHIVLMQRSFLTDHTVLYLPSGGRLSQSASRKRRRY